MRGVVVAVVRLLTTAEYEAAETEIGEDGVITDDMARTIASWWQSSASVGSALASLATGAPFVAASVLDSVSCELTHYRRDRNGASLGGPSDRVEVKQLTALLRWAYSLDVTSVSSSYGHEFMREDGYESCLTCGGVWQVEHDDAENLSHGRYIAANGDHPTECRRDDVTHGAEDECGECKDGTCEACAYECNCFYCR